MKQLTFILTTLLFFSACTLPFQNQDKCPDITLGLSKKTKDWIAPMNMQAANDTLTFTNSLGETRWISVSKQVFNTLKMPIVNCPIQVTQNIIIYSGEYNPLSYSSSNLFIIAMTQNISILPMNSFCDMSKLNTFSTEDETITNRNGLYNYQVINDFDFYGEKLKILNASFGLSSDNCISNKQTNIVEFWISQKYGLIQFKDSYNVIWTRKM